jgi:hypothetical protein
MAYIAGGSTRRTPRTASPRTRPAPPLVCLSSPPCRSSQSVPHRAGMAPGTYSNFHGQRTTSFTNQHSVLLYIIQSEEARFVRSLVRSWLETFWRRGLIGVFTHLI